MDARELPSRPSLEQYRNQAKELLAACRSGDRDAIRRIADCPRLRKPPNAGTPPDVRYALADAQYIIAREHGFESWPKFSKHVEGLKQGSVSLFESAADSKSEIGPCLSPSTCFENFGQLSKPCSRATMY